jgi:hypothetical protein
MQERLWRLLLIQNRTTCSQTIKTTKTTGLILFQQRSLELEGSQVEDQEVLVRTSSGKTSSSNNSHQPKLLNKEDQMFSCQK